MVRQSYNGGNKAPSEQANLAADMRDIRRAIFNSPSGTINGKVSVIQPIRYKSDAETDIEVLGTDAGAYGVPSWCDRGKECS